MLSVEDHIKLITAHSGGMRPHRAFEHVVALIYHTLARDPNPHVDHAARYAETVDRLKAGALDIRQIYAPILARDVIANRDHNPDLLGQIAGHLGTLEKTWGQFFTPFEVCKLTAALTFGDLDVARRAVDEIGYVSIQEPASGSGAMILAAAEYLADQGFDITRGIYVEATDIDPLAMRMCFIQLAARQIPALVILGNSLTCEIHEQTPTAQRWDQKQAEVDRAGAAPSIAAE